MPRGNVLALNHCNIFFFLVFELLFCYFCPLCFRELVLFLWSSIHVFFVIHLLAILEEIKNLRNAAMKESGSSKKSCLALQRALIHCQEIGDEKIALVQLITDLIENRSRQLDQDREHLGQFFFFLNFYELFKQLIVFLTIEQFVSFDYKRCNLITTVWYCNMVELNIEFFVVHDGF